MDLDRRREIAFLSAKARSNFNKRMNSPKEESASREKSYFYFDYDFISNYRT